MAVHVKAVPVNGLVEFVTRELTPEQLSDVRAQLGDDAKWFTGHVLAHDVVPLDKVNRFTTLAAEKKKEPLKVFAKRAGRYGAEIGIKSVYKFILAILSIEHVIRKAPFMWTRVYDGGEIKVETPGDNRAKIRVTNFPAHEAGCGRITGWFELIGEKAGAKELRCFHASCMAEGAPECVWDMAWR